MKVSVGVSNHHVHLNRDDLNILFGEGYELNLYKSLKQYGQYASLEKVDIKVGDKIIKGLRVLGPVRNYTQIEVSKTDCYFLGVNPAVASSGDLSGASEVQIIGPCGSVVRKALIIANRHIHITHEDRIKFGLTNDIVSVKFSTIKGGIMENVYIKEAPNSYFEMHIDTDDANAFLIQNGEEGEIIVD